MAPALINDWKWRVLFLEGVVYPALLVLVAFKAPESPNWYRMRATIIAEASMDESEALLVNNNGDDMRSGWQGLFSSYHRRSLFVGLVLGVVMAFCGINAVLFYAPQIFVQTGFKKEKSLMTVLVGVWNFISTIIAVGGACPRWRLRIWR